MPKSPIRPLRQKLHKADPLCHWCREPTILIASSTTNPSFATIDHVKSRLECASWAEYTAPANKVLACHRCNQQRNDAFWKNNPQPARPSWVDQPKPTKVRQLKLSLPGSHQPTPSPKHECVNVGMGEDLCWRPN